MMNVYITRIVVQNASGGGVALTVKKFLISTNKGVQFLRDHLYEGAVWCEIDLFGKNMLIGTIYRTPNSCRKINNLLCNLTNLSERYNKESQVLTCGDFNFKEICWETNSVLSDGQQIADARKFLDAVNDCFLVQHIEGKHTI